MSQSGQISGAPGLPVHYGTGKYLVSLSVPLGGGATSRLAHEGVLHADHCFLYSKVIKYMFETYRYN